MEQLKKYFLIGMGWLLMYFYPTFQFILLIGFFVVSDSVAGGIAAYKRGEFSSKGFRTVIPKFTIYALALLVAYVAQQSFFPDFPSLKVVSGLIAYGEIISIDEKVKEITGKSLFKIFAKKLQK